MFALSFGTALVEEDLLKNNTLCLLIKSRKNSLHISQHLLNFYCDSFLSAKMVNDKDNNVVRSSETM